jgi:hypothetical protein
MPFESQPILIPCAAAHKKKRRLLYPFTHLRFSPSFTPSAQPRIIDKVRREFTSDPEFTPANAAKASGAAEGMCKWVHAMDSYDKVSAQHTACMIRFPLSCLQ